MLLTVVNLFPVCSHLFSLFSLFYPGCQLVFHLFHVSFYLFTLGATVVGVFTCLFHFCSTFVQLCAFLFHLCSTFVSRCAFWFHFCSFFCSTLVFNCFPEVFLLFRWFVFVQHLFNLCYTLIQFCAFVFHFCSTSVPLFRSKGQHLKNISGPTCEAPTSRPETDIGELGNPVDGHFQLNTFLHHLVPRAKWCKNLFSGIALFPVVCEWEPPTHSRARIRNVAAIWGFVC